MCDLVSKTDLGERSSHESIPRLLISGWVPSSGLRVEAQSHTQSVDWFEMPAHTASAQDASTHSVHVAQLVNYSINILPAPSPHVSNRDPLYLYNVCVLGETGVGVWEQ